MTPKLHRFREAHPLSQRYRDLGGDSPLTFCTHANRSVTKQISKAARIPSVGIVKFLHEILYASSAISLLWPGRICCPAKQEDFGGPESFPKAPLGCLSSSSSLQPHSLCFKFIKD